jgi:5-formyltetrahydrofolate cyclo-ligase
VPDPEAMTDPEEDALRRQVKAELRKRMRSVRKALPAEARAARSASIVARVTARDEWSAAGTVMLFLPMGAEVDVRPAIESALAAGKRVALPRMTPEGLEIRQWRAGDVPVESGSMQVPEPPESAPLVDPAEVELVVVPALALDERGARIGYGAGYYDHLLPRMPRARRIAVAFHFQLLAEIPETPGDQRVHVVVTDERTIDVSIS